MRYSPCLLLFFGLHFTLCNVGKAQVGLTDEMKETERMLAASTKQVNQFFLRFNGEETGKGARLQAGDRQFRATGLRRNFIPNLFNQSGNIDLELAKRFTKLVTDKRAPLFLDRRHDNWIAEVNVTFTYQKETISGLLFLRLEQQGKGYAWILEDVSFDIFKERLSKNPEDHSYFIHPMSHELDFMTFRKAFQKDKNVNQYTSKSFTPDFLTLFLYEMESGRLNFETVKDVKFHFFVFDDWYFSLVNFNRPGFNSGWLIENIFEIKNESQKSQMKDYVYDKN
ncbi:MAG: hypothetical protein AAF616_03020 [Bacteroidota bacterium]